MKLHLQETKADWQNIFHHIFRYFDHFELLPKFLRNHVQKNKELSKVMFFATGQFFWVLKPMHKFHTKQTRVWNFECRRECSSRLFSGDKVFYGKFMLGFWGLLTLKSDLNNQRFLLNYVSKIWVNNQWINKPKTVIDSILWKKRQEGSF